MSALIIYPTQRKAVNAARRACGACRHGDISQVFRSIPGHSARHARGEGFVVCPREGCTDIKGIHKALQMLPQEEPVLVLVYHDTLKG
jgi:hypothetical protein